MAFNELNSVEHYIIYQMNGGVNFNSTLETLNSMVDNKIKLEAIITISQSLQKSLINQIF
ncbi:MAG: hypothetical protein IPN86_18240 [Saprospiraceae bacterium]|nr:hypothetical protein [Saprospiraceae bacterium]